LLPIYVFLGYVFVDTTLTPGRGLIALGLAMDFLRPHLYSIYLISIIILYLLGTDWFFA